MAQQAPSVTGRTSAGACAASSERSSAPCYVFDIVQKAEGVTVDAYREKLKAWCKSWVFQLEKGDTGYLHYQGRVSLIKKRRAPEIASMFNDELYKTKFLPTSNNARDKEAFYCVKADTRVEGPWKDTDLPPITFTRQMLEFQSYTKYPWQLDVERFCTEWDKRSINWIYDAEGCKGKSDLVEWLDTNRIANVVPPMRSAEDIMQFCMSQPPARAYLIDMPRAMKKDNLVEFYAGIEQLKNGFLYDKRYKGQKKWIDRPAVIVFANVPPAMWALSPDRWKMWTIVDYKLEPYTSI